MKLRQQLLDSLFQLERVSDSCFKTNPPHICGNLSSGILFGGQVISQSFGLLQAAVLGRRPNIVPNSLHHRFIAPGRGDAPIRYELDQLETIYRVRVTQEGRLIGICQFTLTEDQFPPFSLQFDGLKSPEELAPLGDICTEINFPQNVDIVREMIWDVRIAEWGRTCPAKPRNLWWCRIQPDCRDLLPASSGLQVVLLLSDFMILQIAEDIYYRNGFFVEMGASLNHSVRFHGGGSEIEPTDWFLYLVECETIGSDRVKLHATVYDQRKMAIVSIIQEGYVLVKPKL